MSRTNMTTITVADSAHQIQMVRKTKTSIADR